MQPSDIDWLKEGKGRSYEISAEPALDCYFCAHSYAF